MIDQSYIDGLIADVNATGAKYVAYQESTDFAWLHADVQRENGPHRLHLKTPVKDKEPARIVEDLKALLTEKLKPSPAKEETHVDHARPTEGRPG